MKIILWVFIFILLLSFKADNEQTYKFEFTQAELQLIYTAVDKSNLPHNQVTEILQKIQSQYTSQLPKTDSTTKKK